MKYQKITFAATLFAALASTSSCSFFETEEVPDLNNLALESVLASPTKAQLDALAVAVEASYRLHHTGNSAYNQVIGTLGREVTVLPATESRWYQELQGNSQLTGVPPLDDAAFYNGYYVNVARIGRAARIYRQSAQNAVPAVLTDEQKAGISGFCRTYEALSKLLLLNMQGEGGTRIDLDNVLRPGPFVTQEAALADIRQLLDQANTDLTTAGTEFAFPLSSGYAGFNTPTLFRRVNRGLAARVALYQRDWAGSLAAIGQSFYDRAGSLAAGPKITFNPANAGDQGNAYFQVTEAAGATVVTVPESFVTEATPGDARLSKVRLRTNPRITGGISARYEVQRFASNTAPLDIIRNEELVLIAAEARARTNNLVGALEDVNAVRQRSGNLPALTVPFATAEAAEEEILRQRRYSLFYEGQWLVDLRRTSRLRPVPAPGITLAYSTAPYRLINRMPRPAAEVAWDRTNP